MKTLILATVSAAALLTAGIASAQILPTDSNFLHITPGQQTAGENASSNVDQSGSGNVANVTQTQVTNGFSVVVQSGASKYGVNGTANTADVTQTGRNARSLVLQNQDGGDTNHGTVTQSGLNEQAVIYTNGNSVTDTITQNSQNDGSVSGGNLFGVNGRSGSSAGTAALSYAEQLTPAQLDAGATGVSGYGAAIVQDRLGGFSSASVTQTGSKNNRGLILQTNSTFEKASIAQTGSGSGNFAGVMQENGAFHSAVINQTDATNSSASIEQIGGFSGHFAQIDQTGLSNKATTFQSGYTPADYSYTSQKGTLETATVSQTGGSDTSLVFQGLTGPGNNNTANVSQKGANAYSTVTQNGGFNVATIKQ